MLVKPFGSGENGIMIIGESPSSIGSGKTGIPFSGKAGVKFFAALQQLGIEKDECYIDNVINWYPFDKKSPNFYGMVSSRIKKLREQILEIKPKSVLCLGKYASETFSKRIWERKNKPFSMSVTCKQFKFDLIVAFHPSHVYNYMKKSDTEYIKEIVELIMR